MKRRTYLWIIRILLVSLLALFILGYLVFEPFRQWLDQVFTLFSSMNAEEMADYIYSFGIWAVGVSFLLMVFQSVAAPLPAFLITFANAAIWGWIQGAILSWLSAMVGAFLCFSIARILGRGAVERILPKFTMGQVDAYFEKYGKNTILICRLLPFVSFDFISYGAGLTSMKALPFLIATGVGQLPATLIYSYIGSMLTGKMKIAVTALLVLFAIGTLISLLRGLRLKVKE